MRHMAVVTRLVTVVDVDDRAGSPGLVVADGSATDASGWAPAPTDPRPCDPRVMSLTALHLAVLDDGRRLPLLDDRGWTESGPGDVWRTTSAGSIAAQARTVVGPDEPPGGRSSEEEARAHWEHLAAVLEHQGVDVGAQELSRMPHDVELTDRLRHLVADDPSLHTP